MYRGEVEMTHIVLRPANCISHQEEMVPMAPMKNMIKLRVEAVELESPACDKK